MGLGVCMCGYGVYLGRSRCDAHCQTPRGPGHWLYVRPAWVQPAVKSRLAARLAAARRATRRVIRPTRCEVRPQPKRRPKPKHPSNASSASAASSNESTRLIDPHVVEFLPAGEQISHICSSCDTNPIRVIFRTCKHEILCQQCWGELLAHSSDLPECPRCGVVVRDAKVLGLDEEESSDME